MSERPIVKIDIIGGFLGAGKTTFLNKLLHDGLKSERVVIIENEFGDEPVDDAVLEGNGIEMRTLPSGCICCTLKADFITSIEDIVARCNPDRILIEPTGLASPAELRTTCELAAGIPNMSADVRLNSITAIVDATDAVEMIGYEMPVYLHQIDQAHVIVLSHTQELDDGALREAVEAIRAIAPTRAIVIDRSWDQFDALEILALSEQKFAEQDIAHSESARADNRDHDHRDHHDGHGHHHSYEGFSARTRTLTEPFDDDSVERLTASLASQGVMRAKGFLPSASGGLLHYEYVNGRASAIPTDYDGAAKLVTIGRS